MTLFEVLGFRWDRSVVPASIPSHPIERVCFRFHKMLPEFVWDASVLKGNPFSFPEIKTLLDGVTVGGHRITVESAWTGGDQAGAIPPVPQDETRILKRAARESYRALV
jgi:hypothetical protein